MQCFPELANELEDGSEQWAAEYTRAIGRALLDSYSVEVLSHVDPSKCTSFVDFAFSWLEKYDVDTDNGKVIDAVVEEEQDVYEPRVSQYF